MDRDKEIEQKKLTSYIKKVYPFYEYGMWALILRKNHQIIGKVGLSNREYKGANCVELGYLIDWDYRRKGYAREACKLCIQYAKEELYLDEIYCFVNEENRNSLYLALRLGFEVIDKEKYLKESCYVLRKKL